MPKASRELHRWSHKVRADIKKLESETAMPKASRELHRWSHKVRADIKKLESETAS